MCKHDFIITVNEKNYYKQKEEMENELSEFIDKMIDKQEELCWKIVMHKEALLLGPGQEPKYCSKSCGSVICAHCYRTYTCCLACKA
jgi:hypothetical protein